MIVVEETDPPEAAAALARLSGELAFDIGANAGQATKVLLRSCSRLVAVEPNPDAFHELMLTARASGIEPGQMVGVNAACGSTDGWLEVGMRSEHLKRGQYVHPLLEQPADEHGWGDDAGRTRVQSMTVDTLASRYGIPDVLKIDVEGFEYEVLMGAWDTLARAPALFVEIHDAAIGRDCWDLIVEKYPAPVRRIEHPNYAPGSWGRRNHWWVTSL